MSTIVNNLTPQEWDIRTQEPFYMGESIEKIPATIQACLDPDFLNGIRARMAVIKPDRVFTIGTGTSLNACEAIAYTCRKLLNIPVTACESVDFELDTPLGVDSKTLVIAISHSGGTLATALAVNKAKTLGAFTVGISANAGSRLASAADYALTDPNPYEGRPRGKTRSYHSSVLLGTLAAVMTASPDVQETFLTGAQKLVSLIQHSQGRWEKAARAIAAEWADRVSRYMVAGFGVQKPNADETGLKIIEVLGENATSYSLEELTHGPGASFRQDMGIILFQTDPRTLARCLEVARGISASHASLVVITDQAGAGWPGRARVVEIPAVERPELFALYPAAAAAQNLLYYLAIEKGRSPDENCRLEHPEVVEVSAIFFPPGTH